MPPRLERYIKDDKTRVYLWVLILQAVLLAVVMAL